MMIQRFGGCPDDHPPCVSINRRPGGVGALADGQIIQSQLQIVSSGRRTTVSGWGPSVWTRRAHLAGSLVTFPATRRGPRRRRCSSAGRLSGGGGGGPAKCDHPARPRRWAPGVPGCSTGRPALWVIATRGRIRAFGWCRVGRYHHLLFVTALDVVVLVRPGVVSPHGLARRSALPRLEVLRGAGTVPHRMAGRAGRHAA